MYQVKQTLTWITFFKPIHRDQFELAVHFCLLIFFKYVYFTQPACLETYFLAKYLEITTFCFVIIQSAVRTLVEYDTTKEMFKQNQQTKLMSSIHCCQIHYINLYKSLETLGCDLCRLCSSKRNYNSRVVMRLANE